MAAIPNWICPRLSGETIDALTGRIEVVSRRSAGPDILEDAHWADPSTLEAFSRVIDKIGSRSGRCWS